MSMLLPGLVSITYRRLAAEAVVRLAADAGIQGMEWGGDVHARPGDLAQAQTLGTWTRDAGMTVCAYGSYARMRTAAEGEPDHEAVLDTAEALGTRLIRVWAGAQGSAVMPAVERGLVIERLTRLVDRAGRRGLVVATEWHANTLTDTLASAASLFAAVPGLRTFWQPRSESPDVADHEQLAAVLPRVESLHVFHWIQYARQPLGDGASAWAPWLALARSDGRDRYACLEFVPGDDPTLLVREAATLRSWIVP